MVCRQSSMRPTSAATFESLLTRAEVRATPLSEMARWKRFLARGDNTCRTVLRREFMLREEGGLFLKSHTHPHPCPGLLPWRPGPGSVRKPQLEGGRSRVRDRTGGEWRPLTVTINSI